MLDLSKLLHEISVAFGCSANLRTLLPRLADGMARHLPVIELEIAWLIEHVDEVRICAYAPESGRRWEGRRSARYLEGQGVRAPTLVADELAWVGIAAIASKLKLPVGRTGLLSIALETDISVLLGSRERREILVDVLTLHCLRLGQLSATANRCRAAHQRDIGTDISVDTVRPSAAESSVKRESSFTEISLPPHRHFVSENPVETIDTALVRCISAALDQSGGKIYGRGGAAEILGLKPSTLQSKMRKLGIARSAFTQV